MPEDPGVMPEDPEVMPEDPEVMPEDPEVTPEVTPEVSGSTTRKARILVSFFFPYNSAIWNWTSTALDNSLYVTINNL